MTLSPARFNEKLLQAEYAVRGPIVERAQHFRYFSRWSAAEIPA